jgi:hypothetical protein
MAQQPEPIQANHLEHLEFEKNEDKENSSSFVEAPKRN